MDNRAARVVAAVRLGIQEMQVVQGAYGKMKTLFAEQAQTGEVRNQIAQLITAMYGKMNKLEQTLQLISQVEGYKSMLARTSEKDKVLAHGSLTKYYKQLYGEANENAAKVNMQLNELGEDIAQADNLTNKYEIIMKGEMVQLRDFRKYIRAARDLQNKIQSNMELPK